MLFKPFDFDPVSTSVKTGSYTVPAGRYALIVPNGVWLSIAGTKLGFEPTDVNANTSGGAASLEYATLLTNNSPNNVYGSIKIDGNPLGATDVAGVYVNAIGETSTGLNLEDGVSSQGAGVNKYKLYTTGTTPYLWSEIGQTKIIEIPPGHTCYRAWRHQAAGDIDIDVRFFSLTKLDGSHWVDPGTAIDGDNYTVMEYIIPT